MADIKGYYTIGEEQQMLASPSNIPAYKKAKKSASRIIETGVNIEKFDNLGLRRLNIFWRILIASCLGLILFFVWKKIFI